MPLDTIFFQAVQELKAPRAGTELMGPLLYNLIRTTRPQKLLEVGMGYTTPFILEALKDNIKDINTEKKMLKIKSEKFLNNLKMIGEIDFTKNSRTLLLMDEWLEEEPALISPAFHLNNYQPVLHAIDNYSSDKSFANRVKCVLENMHFHDLFKVYNKNFHNLSVHLDPHIFPLDFVWFDCGSLNDYKKFLEEYWDKIDSEGGYLLLHCTLNRSGLHNIIQYLKLKQATKQFMDFEMMSLKEPHKLTQGSVTIIRKAKTQIPYFPIEIAEELFENIKKL